ncbi:PIN domain nuclease [Sphingomonas sp.]|uniref:type II toxin-antitoxin system VapC family toxin n=1 Tax=Sphingomonas sp. TaxID=28214 RepID=UPI0035AFBD52
MTILVDSSVWIDLFRDRDTRQTHRLRDLIASRARIVIGDLVLVEVLQGAPNDRAAASMEAAFAAFETLTIVDPGAALQAARHYRTLRTLGITIRKTIDTLIATRCILDGTPLLYSDRDFDPFVRHLGLIPVLEPASGVN